MKETMNDTMVPMVPKVMSGIDRFINDAMGTSLVTTNEANMSVQQFMATHPNAWLVTRTEMYVIVLGVLLVGVLVGYLTHWYRIRRKVKKLRMAKSGEAKGRGA